MLVMKPDCGRAKNRDCRERDGDGRVGAHFTSRPKVPGVDCHDRLLQTVTVCHLRTSCDTMGCSIARIAGSRRGAGRFLGDPFMWTMTCAFASRFCGQTRANPCPERMWTPAVAIRRDPHRATRRMRFCGRMWSAQFRAPCPGRERIRVETACKLGSSAQSLKSRCDAGAEELNGAHQRCVRKRGQVHLERQPRDAAQHRVVVSDPVDHVIRAAHDQRATRADLCIEVGAGWLCATMGYVVATASTLSVD